MAYYPAIEKYGNKYSTMGPGYVGYESEALCTKCDIMRVFAYPGRSCPTPNCGGIMGPAPTVPYVPRGKCGKLLMCFPGGHVKCYCQ